MAAPLHRQFSDMTLAVQHWPGPLLMPASGLLLIGLRTPQGEDRTQARLLVRQALASVANVSAGAGVSISHASGFSVAAVHRHGPVGIDLMRLEGGLIPDWKAVARDYLGPAAVARIAACNDDRRARCFAQEWTRREAQLKRHGCGLVEWADAPLMRDGSYSPLALQESYVGAVVIGSPD
ncbi:4'-phosphopantetheinyl transferase superfamily protein [Actimicrobium sp. CCC2.4]|uniref:4'-phosphopantetheinyl transferase family protein n=1 Tax=Actimicrobium sp. CCC2.4 TaxID=3048606 RepID=UPI002AC925A3|nr:4'-phosphopantetheinyl transferase superfamily protein [Actimicrobium sp. CCC2.4]MEB0135085.1 4'-phosphopantetheinyl transferase superfamily protein [Actimicrobium sp. CCC2.4]WPX31868.1 4'-phosphopantetheinyl transferase superfamily protein [Actimicrobium sp. CCC2.4]